MNAWIAFALGAGTVLVLKTLSRFSHGCCGGASTRVGYRHGHEHGDGCCGHRGKSGEPDAETSLTG